MTVGAVVAETIALRRAYDCERAGTHDWKTRTSTEDRCQRCGIIATPDGKKRLAEQAKRFFG